MPSWLADMGRRAARDSAPELARYAFPDTAGKRASAVLVLFGAGDDGPDLLFLQRSDTLRDHPGQVCFPGGSVRSDDRDAAHTALRELSEETGLDPASVHVVAPLPPLYLAWSGFAVTPVLGWWDGVGELAGDGDEIVSVHRVPVRDLGEPACRLQLRFPTGYLGPGFLVGGLFVWGFTGSIVAWLLRLGGWERASDAGRVEELAEAKLRYGGELPRPPAGGSDAAARLGR
ncbi:coenzyme A pyrophosphatase [Streptomyces sulfonofaciens]|uniref:Coenzyme A pyrophosphatase n=1 Tax=Streptomyces sulfonofaciens TaxID=68272 RepID=A0A919L188_9ACTN|nr:coenzyme A pyrophosphatase [Streptomyces sulfonofaciens]